MLREETPNLAEAMMHQSEEGGSHAVQAHRSALPTIVMIAVFLAGFTMLIVAVIVELVS
jgi:hypothetical protein